METGDAHLIKTHKEALDWYMGNGNSKIKDSIIAGVKQIIPGTTKFIYRYLLFCDS